MTAPLSPPKRRTWFHITMGVSLLLVAILLTVGWQLIGSEQAALSASPTARYLVYFFGLLLFLLLISGMGLMFTLLLREVRLNERQSNFVSAVTHELKTPVASLRLYLDTLVLRAETLSAAQRGDFYETMRADLDRLNGTINNVLNAGMYTDRAVVNPPTFDLARLVQHACALTGTRNQLSAKALKYSGPASLLLKGDATAIETAVLNLLDNAVKYSTDQVQVKVRLEEESGGFARLAVTDRGVGMNRAHLRFIFNRFYRIGSEVRRSRTGTGLGLFIVKSVAKAHGGTVNAESEGEGQGTTFILRLPRLVRENHAEAREGVAHA
ncbi:MAG: HAMP domain-containing histidine kinase [Vicinamibacteria bacterium]|nr:HAMP domain-containing histidine kinase [Vicinamibacteria bacterium]